MIFALNLKIGTGLVDVAYWDKIHKVSFEALTSNPRWPLHYTAFGHMDNFDTPPNFGSHYALRMWGYFYAPATGDYTFYVASGDLSILKLAKNVAKWDQAETIITSRGRTKRYHYDK